VSHGRIRIPPHNRKSEGRKLPTYSCAHLYSTRPACMLTCLTVGLCRQPSKGLLVFGVRRSPCGRLPLPLVWRRSAPLSYAIQGQSQTEQREQEYLVQKQIAPHLVSLTWRSNVGMFPVF
jgi:hypothetical protein